MAVTSADSESLKPETKKRELKFRKRIGRIIRYVLLILLGLAVFTPFILAFLGTFKTGAEIIAFPPTFLPVEWIVENWPELFSTDLGGAPRPEGSTSIGLIVGLFAFYATFLLTAMTNQQEGKGLPRKFGLPLSLLLIAGAGFGVFYYLGNAFIAPLVLQVSTAIAIVSLMLIALGIIAMSEPDWGRVVLSMAGSIIEASMKPKMKPFPGNLSRAKA
jgi:ABC-type maltose transport system permease subunit